MAHEIYENTIIERFTNGKSETTLQIGVDESHDKETYYYFVMFRFSYEGRKIGYFRTQLEGDTVKYFDMATARLEKDYPELKREAIARYNELHQKFPLSF